jgi:signal peptidase II
LVAAAVVVLTADQATKRIIVAAIGPDQVRHQIEIVNGWLALAYAENRGAAFGLFAGLAPVLTIVSLAILVGLFVHYAREPAPPLWQTLALGAVAGGAFGNLADRLRLGYVVDFLAVGAWPNFNLGDSAITLGMLTLIWGWTRGELASGSRDAVRTG